MERVIVCTLPVCPHLWSITLMVSFSCPRPIIIHQGHSMQLSDLLSLIWFKLTQVFLGYIFFKYQTYSPLCRIYWFWETTWSSEKKIRSLKGGLFRRHAVHCSPYSNRHGYVYSHPNHISSSQSIFTSIFHCFK